MNELEKHFPNVGVMTGSTHVVSAEARKMERRKEIKIVGMQTTRVTRHVYYVRLKSLRRVRRERALRVGTPIVGVLALISWVAWMLWSVRSLLAEVGLAILLTAALLWLVPHWKSGCPGVHCECGS